MKEDSGTGNRGKEETENEWKKDQNQFYLLELLSIPFLVFSFGFYVILPMLCFYLFCGHKGSKYFSGHLLIVETNGLSFRWWMRMNKSGSGCVASISVIYFLFQISSQMDFLCCPGDNSSLWQQSTPPAVIAWVYYYKEKCCSMYRTLSNAYIRITVCVWNIHACFT